MGLRGAKSPTSDVTPREKMRRCNKMLQMSKVVNGETCIQTGLLMAAAHNSSAAKLADHFSQVPIFQKAAKILSKRDLPASIKNSELKSIRTLYCCGIMTKRKYNSQLKIETDSLKQSTVPTQSIPKLLPYAKVQKMVKDIPKPELHQVLGTEAYYYKLSDLLQHVLPVYLEAAKQDPSSTKWFGSPNKFEIALGEDGAPLSSLREMHVMLLSVINSTSTLSSITNNHVFMAGEVKENDERLAQYYGSLKNEMDCLKKDGLTIGGQHYDVEFSLFPCDQKFHAFLAGELSNAATYCSTYACIRQDDLARDDATVGVGSRVEAGWKPWGYSQRLAVAAKVQRFKQSIPNLARPKVTGFIAKQKSRQEFVPLLGQFCDKFLIEPLHVKNNSMRAFFMRLLAEALLLSEPCQLKNPISGEGCLPEFMKALKEQVGAGRVYVKIKKFFALNSLKQDTKLPEFRFTGEDSLKVGQKFAALTEVLRRFSVGSTLYRIHVLHEIGVNVVNACSLMSQLDITTEKLLLLDNSCKIYYNLHKVNLDTNLSVWSLGYIVPRHAKIVHERFGTGLGINSAQGREAKHRQVKTFIKHSTIQDRWQKVFLHDYVETIYLPAQALKKPTKRAKRKHINAKLPNVCEICGNSVLPCPFCSHAARQLIVESGLRGKRHPDINVEGFV